MARMEDTHKRLPTKREDDIVIILRREITGLKKALVKIDKDINSMPSLDSITKNIKRILDILQELSDNQHIPRKYLYIGAPILDLLSIGPLTRTEVPLVVLDQLISVGFDVNSYTFSGKTCLDIAIEKHHYDAIRLLVKHGELVSEKPPLVSLASQRSVPLDLFDLFVTPQNLNDCGTSRYLPLHTAASCGLTGAALHLIKLGASVNQRDGYQKLPTEYFVEKCAHNVDIKLYRKLLPIQFHVADTLRLTCKTLSNEMLDKENPLMFEMFHQLLQRLHFGEPLKVQITYQHIAINDVIIDKCQSMHLYLYSLILVELQIYSVSVPDQIVDTLPQSMTVTTLNYAQATDELWRNYNKEYHVKSLLRLCILCTRNSMHNLDDESFLSLPIPPYIRKLLTYRDVSERIFERWCCGLAVSS